jgi:hypothetical protein
MKVEPSALTSVGAALAAHPEPDVVAATAGPTNLMAEVTCRDTKTSSATSPSGWRRSTACANWRPHP